MIIFSKNVRVLEGQRKKRREMIRCVKKGSTESLRLYCINKTAIDGGLLEVVPLWSVTLEAKEIGRAHV